MRFYLWTYIDGILFFVVKPQGRIAAQIRDADHLDINIGHNIAQDGLKLRNEPRKYRHRKLTVHNRGVHGA